jgi:hypothetical protein
MLYHWREKKPRQSGVGGDRREKWRLPCGFQKCLGYNASSCNIRSYLLFLFYKQFIGLVKKIKNNKTSCYFLWASFLCFGFFWGGVGMGNEICPLILALVLYFLCYPMFRQLTFWSRMLYKGFNEQSSVSTWRNFNEARVPLFPVLGPIVTYSRWPRNT